MQIEKKETLENDFDISISKTNEQQIDTFEQLFKIYNNHTNLISKNGEIHLFEKHIYDSLSFLLFKNRYITSENTKLLDIGTGGGFPSIPIAITCENIDIYPIDSIAKKIGFIELIQKELRLQNLHPICKRVEDLELKQKASFDIVTSRAVAPLNTLLEYAIPFLKQNGYFIAYKSKNADEEIQNAQNALSVLKAEIIDRIEYKLPKLEEYTRELIVIKKIGKTPSMYPRKSGQAKKNPI